MLVPNLHVVVFDVNVYLDVARLLGPPFSWEKFDEFAARCSTDPVPSTSPLLDSLRALAVCLSGRMSGSEPLQVWTSDHIDALVKLKGMQPTSASIDEDRGLGWSPDDAEDLLEDLVHDLVYARSYGGSMGEIRISRDSPPLSHEDGCVYRTAAEAGDVDDLPDEAGELMRYCVTRDRAFREATLSGDITVLYPWEWVRLVRQRRFAWGTAAMKPLRPPIP